MTIRKPIALPALITAALALSASAAWAQRPLPIRIMPVAPAPAPAAQPATNPQLQMPKGPITSAADPLELLKQVNILRGQVAALQQQTAALQQQTTTLQGQAGTQAKMIDSLKNGLATVSLKGITNTNDLVAVTGGLASLQSELANVKGELGNVKSEAISLKSSFDNHKHYQRFGHLLNGKETVDDIVTSVPSLYCKPANSGSGVHCNAPL